MKEIRDERISPKMGTERVRQRERERERGGRGTGEPIGMENQVGVKRQGKSERRKQRTGEVMDRVWREQKYGRFLKNIL